MCNGIITQPLMNILYLKKQRSQDIYAIIGNTIYGTKIKKFHKSQ